MTQFLRTPYFVCLWRNKDFACRAETIDDMIAAMRKAADTLQELKEAGVVLDRDRSDMRNGYGVLVSADPAAAEKFVSEQFAFQRDWASQRAPLPLFHDAARKEEGEGAVAAEEGEKAAGS